VYDIYDKTLDELLEELKVFGTIHIEFTNFKWHFKYTTKLNDKDYMFENSGPYLFDIVKSCVIAINKFPIYK